MIRNIARSHGKCILSGEHTVLRGGEALVLPLKSFSLEIEKISEGEGIWITGESTKTWTPFEGGDAFQRFLENFFQETLPGILIHLNMPLGCGLGGSAALAVGLVRLFRPHFSEEKIFETALPIEGFFHGTTSGVDIAGVLANGPQLYRKEPFKIIPLSFISDSPFFLSFCGEMGKTRPAIEEVSRLRKTNPQLSETIDDQMKEATQTILKGILNNSDSLSALAQGVTLAKECFDAWGLITKEMRQEMERLLKNGALAVKPTGSGLGGFILSVWDRTPPLQLFPVRFEL
ncbi:MAG: hypothetical protein K2P90_01250 [Holosporales bacterium]|nr:hypothetical protein [Holosporales bacterium]